MSLHRWKSYPAPFGATYTHQVTVIHHHDNSVYYAQGYALSRDYYVGTLMLVIPELHKKLIKIQQLDKESTGDKAMDKTQQFQIQAPELKQVTPDNKPNALLVHFVMISACVCLEISTQSGCCL